MNDAPRQTGTLGSFIVAASEMDPELRIFVQEPWGRNAAAIATVSALPGRTSQARSDADAYYSEVFGEGPDGASEGSGFSFFGYVAGLQAALRQLRRQGVKDAARVCEAVIARAREG
ncbi:MAG: hypothetical protein U1F43_28910 [Myxococcota bacterium]